MSFVYLLLRVLPLWILPMSYIMVELGINLRQKDKTLQFALLMFIVFVNVIITILWAFNAGWVTFPDFVKSLIEESTKY